MNNFVFNEFNSKKKSNKLMDIHLNNTKFTYHLPSHYQLTIKLLSNVTAEQNKISIYLLH